MSAMVTFYELLKIIIPLLAGGGITWLFAFRRKKQRIETNLALEEYKDVDSFIQDLTQKMMKLSNDLLELNKEHLETQQLLQRLEQDHRSLTDKINRFKAACSCGAKDLL